MSVSPVPPVPELPIGVSPPPALPPVLVGNAVKLPPPEGLVLSPPLPPPLPPDPGPPPDGRPGNPPVGISLPLGPGYRPGRALKLSAPDSYPLPMASQ